MRHIFKKIVTKILMVEARAVLRKYKPNVIAITGNLGKTSAKDAIYATLAERCFVRKSDKSFNSDIGVPLTILGCPTGWNNPLRWLWNIFDGLLLVISKSEYPDWLVIEVGADRPGDIRTMASWLPIDIAVITRVPEVPVHVEYFSSPEEVIAEKAALISAMKPSGTLVLYADDPRTRALASLAPKSRVITYGFSEGSDVRGINLEIVYADESTHPRGVPIGMRAHIVNKDLDTEECSEIFVEGTLGYQAILPCIAAAAVATSVGMPLSEAVQSFQMHQEPPRGRMRVLAGLHGSVIIDDTYNSSPAAVNAALETLHELRVRGKKIVVLGDMMELGRYSVETHRKAGVLAAGCADKLVTVGIRMRDAAQSALASGMSESAIFEYENAEQAGEEIARYLEDGDCVLVKGSQSLRMERAVKVLMADATKAEALLVRQEEEWSKR